MYYRVSTPIKLSNYSNHEVINLYESQTLLTITLTFLQHNLKANESLLQLLVRSFVITLGGHGKLNNIDKLLNNFAIKSFTCINTGSVSKLKELLVN